MNPNSYGQPPLYTPQGWPPQQQQQVPLVDPSPTSVHSNLGGVLNGNYQQQQLASSMGGLSLHTSKQNYASSIPPSSGNTAISSMGQNVNGGNNNISMPVNNNPMKIGSYMNGPNNTNPASVMSTAPSKSMDYPITSMGQQLQMPTSRTPDSIAMEAHIQPSAFVPTARRVTNENESESGSISGKFNMNSASNLGLPQMPPRMATNDASDQILQSTNRQQPLPELANDPTDAKYPLQQGSPIHDQMQLGQGSLNFGLSTTQSQFEKVSPPGAYTLSKPDPITAHPGQLSSTSSHMVPQGTGQIPSQSQQSEQMSSRSAQITSQTGQSSNSEGVPQMNFQTSMAGPMPLIQPQPTKSVQQASQVDLTTPKTGQIPPHPQMQHTTGQQQNQIPFQQGISGAMQYQPLQTSHMSFQSKNSGLQTQQGQQGMPAMPAPGMMPSVQGHSTSHLMASQQNPHAVLAQHGQQIITPQQGQQQMKAPQQGQQQMTPPLQGQQQMKPPQQGQQQMMPPQQGQQQMMPPQQGQQQIKPPQQGQQQMMPPQQGQQQMMPPQQGQQQMMPPQQGQQQMMPPQQGQQHTMPPKQGQHMIPPQQVQQQMMPLQQGQQIMSPQQEQQQIMAPHQGQQIMPPQQGKQMMPPQQGQKMMPPLQGQQVMNFQQGHSMMPPSQGQMVPPQPRQHMMPPQPGQQMMSSQTEQQMMPPQPGQHMMAPLQGQQMIPPSQQAQQIMPPQPGQQIQNRPGYNQPPGMYQQPQAMPRRLDPDQMPNPIQVMIENQRNAGGIFVTNQPGLVPPLVTTKYVVQDQGNSSPRYLRSSLYCIPTTSDLIKTTALPFSLIISPFARITEEEYEPPIVDFGELGPIRCNRCKAYMSPNMQFIDAGRRFQCLMCKVSTEVPQEYFQHLDHTGQRVDKYERPELVLGTYEFIATKDYCRNNTPPEVPAFIFIIDVSYNTIKSGLVHLLCSEVKRILRHLPVDQNNEKSKVRVGFITYNSTVHFYNIKSNLAQPQMMVVGDVQDMFMPLLDGFLCHPEESEVVIDALMEQIPKMFVDTKETETILYPAIQAGFEALKASNCAGKLLVFNSTLPIAEAPGKLKNRDDRKLLGTEKEKTVLAPQNNTYNTLGQECVQFGCSVDLFLFNNSYIDIATIGQVSRLTGGEVFKYTYFQAENDGKRLIEDIIKNVSRPIGFDAVMRVRSSQGIRATSFYGHYFMSNTTDVELASIDATKSVAIEIKHDDKLSPDENIYLQIALLYTSCSGQRRLRVLNLALKTSSIIADIFKSCDLDAIILFFAKQSMFKLMELSPKAVKDTLIQRTAQILACYRKHCTSPTSAGQLILPECLKLLPLYLSCLVKNDAVSGGSDMTVDDRSYVIQFVLSMDLPMSVSYFYPRFIPIHNVEVNETDIPMSMRCTHEKMCEDGAYILENGVYLFIWLGQSLPQTFIQPLFGVQCTQQVNAERFSIIGDTPLAERIKQIIDSIMRERTRYMRITCVRQNDKLESIFRHFLVEDRGTDGSPNYVDFLCHMHKEIKDLLS